tara:strand:- start:694 stop:891 length:198 start_codon:yes stop_codon:yes gene_type:complete
MATLLTFDGIGNKSLKGLSVIKSSQRRNIAWFDILKLASGEDCYVQFEAIYIENLSEIFNTFLIG